MICSSQLRVSHPSPHHAKSVGSNPFLPPARLLPLPRSSASMIQQRLRFPRLKPVHTGLPSLKDMNRVKFMRPVSISNASLSTEDDWNHGDFAKKVVKAVLSIAIPLALVTLTGSQSAIASSSITLPSVTNSTSSGRDLLVSAWMGLMAGCLHTLTGPDHLAALAPLSIGRSWLESVSVGALWGCGHDAGQVIFGILFLVLKDKLHIEILRTWGARVVGVTLLTIGMVGIKEAQEAASSIPLLAGNMNELYPPLSAGSMSGAKKNVGFATFATGIVHGLQPDALIMILPALALPSRLAGAAFLGMFLFGTVLAMSGYTAFLGTCSHALQKKIPRITEHLSWISSLVAIFVGIAILAGELFGLSIL